MYRHCIHCSARLGENEALEAFPVGRRIAFDAALGRLWVVCGSCGRWNLAPLEERWETVEEAERLFRGTRTRVQHENIGISRLRDGTELVRVGDALPGEMASWRYGRRLVGRRRKYLFFAGLGTAATFLTWAGMYGGFPLAPLALSSMVVYRRLREEWRQTETVISPIGSGELPGEEPFVVRATHVRAARIGLEADGSGLTLEFTDIGLPRALMSEGRTDTGRKLLLPDAVARRVIRRGVAHLNEAGASEIDVAIGMEILEREGGPAGYLRSLGKRGAPMGARTDDVAFEMALHEEEERQALAGELALLQAAWREAEEIAGIADSLLDPGS
ncbi:MAG TPA: hypothetical protein VF263_05070 [Longimicrobiaceae bacterium]